MKLLGWWLMAVGTIRLALVWCGFFDTQLLRRLIYSKASVSEVGGQTFGVWMVLSSSLCYLCAFNLENKPLCLATSLTFVYGLPYLLAECLIYHTMPIADLLPFAIIAGISMAWMLVHWNSHQPAPATKYH